MASVAGLKRIFSGIQPTGIPHLGNYFGALVRWIKLTNDRKCLLDKKEVECDIPVFSIVDIHAYTANKAPFGQQLYDNLLSTTASLLALGLQPDKCILFRQSDILEHNFLDNVFDNFVSPNRLSRMTQFKDKSKGSGKGQLSNGLLNYPVLQAADILLYRAHLVPVGEDQVQHIELTRDIAKKFNILTGEELFPLPEALLDDNIHSRRIKSLRDPEKKMSKSDSNKKSFIEVVDEPDVIVEKCKKALSDCTGAVYYDVNNRPAISNLIRIYHLATGESFEIIQEEFKGKETSLFKLSLADVLIETFRSTRREYKRIRSDKAYLEEVLRLGAAKAKPLAWATFTRVRHLLGSYREAAK